jgi:hypothetical protein
MPALDPAAIQFVETVARGAASAGDSVAGILIRLLARVSALEKLAKAQALELDRLRKMPRLPLTAAPREVVETGIDVRDGSPVRLERKVSRPVGRPKGSKDSRPRKRHLPLVSQSIIDADFDNLG